MFDNEKIPEEMWSLFEELEVPHVRRGILEIFGAKKRQLQFVVRSYAGTWECKRRRYVNTLSSR